MNRRVVITGGGAVTSLGNDWDTILKSLKAEKNAVVYMDEWTKYKGLNTKLAAPVENWTPPPYSRKKIRGMGRVALLAVHASEMALESAGLIDDPVLRNGEAGVSYGSSTGNIDGLLDFYSMLTDNEVQGITATTYIRSMPQTCAVNIGVFFGLQGRMLTSNTACTSGSISIGMGFESIRDGKQKIMVCGGAEEMGPANAAVFDTLFATSVMNDTPALTPSPFDRDRDGLVIGEGAGTLILEELDHALSRGAKIYAELVGFGTNTDGTHITQPNKETMEKAMHLALESAGLDAEDIGYINGHGTATQHGDIAESQATANCFKRRVPYSSLKSYMGHTLGACGAIETWIAINMMNGGWIAPNLNLKTVDENCGDLDYIMEGGRDLSPKYIMCNNFAFGGINTSLILRKWEN